MAVVVLPITAEDVVDMDSKPDCSMDGLAASLIDGIILMRSFRLLRLSTKDEILEVVTAAAAVVVVGVFAAAPIGGVFSCDFCCCCRDDNKDNNGLREEIYDDARVTRWAFIPL